MAACKLVGVLEEQIGDGATVTFYKYRNLDDTVAMDTLVICRTMLLYSMRGIGRRLAACDCDQESWHPEGASSAARLHGQAARVSSNKDDYQSSHLPICRLYGDTRAKELYQAL